MFEAGSFGIWLLPLVSFLVVVVAVLPSVKLARMAGVIDRPGGRKQHEKAVPPVGGLVVFPVFMLVALLAGVDLVKYWPLYVGLIVLLVTGALDDRFGLNPWLKFWTQIGVAILIVEFGEARVMHLGLFGDDIFWTGWVAYPFTIAAVVLLINAVNLMDGLDGLAAGKAVVMLLWFIVTAAAGYTQLALLMGILVGALGGFLVYNMRNPWRRKASVFLGDAGSMCLGLALAWFAITMAKWPMMPLAPITVAWIVGLPIFDACAQFHRRIREGRHPFSPDRGHFHHHFIDAGIPVHVTSPVIMLIVAFMGAFGYFGVRFGIPEAVMMVLWAGALFAHMAMSYRKERYVRLIARLSGTRVDPVVSAPKKI